MRQYVSWGVVISGCSERLWEQLMSDINLTGQIGMQQCNPLRFSIVLSIDFVISTKQKSSQCYSTFLAGCRRA